MTSPSENEPNSSPIPIPLPTNQNQSTGIQSKNVTTSPPLPLPPPLLPGHDDPTTSVFSPSRPPTTKTSPTIDPESRSSSFSNHSQSTSSTTKSSTHNNNRQRARTPSISLTLIRAPPNTPIGPSHSINPFSNNQNINKESSQRQESNNSSYPSRLAFSFSSPKPSTSPTSSFINSQQQHQRVDSQINLLPLTSIQHQQILLPFLNRSTEISDLLFKNPKTEVLSKRIASTLHAVNSVGVEKDDYQLFKEIINTPRKVLDDDQSLIQEDKNQTKILDDLEFLSELRDLVEPKDKDLWARLKSCLGADGLLEEYEFEIQQLEKVSKYHHHQQQQVFDNSYSWNDSAIDDDEEDEEEETDISNEATIASSSSSSTSSVDSSYDDSHNHNSNQQSQAFDFNNSHSMDKILNSQFNLQPFTVQLPISGSDIRANRLSNQNQGFNLDSSSSSNISDQFSRFDNSNDGGDRELSPLGGSRRRSSRSLVQSDDMDENPSSPEIKVDIEPLKELPSSFGNSLPKLVASSEKQAQESISTKELEEIEPPSTVIDNSDRHDIDISQPSDQHLGHGFTSIHVGGNHGGIGHVRSRSLSSGSSAGSMGGLTLSKILEEEELGKKIGGNFSDVTSKIEEKLKNQKLEEEKEKEKDSTKVIENLSEPKRFAGLRISTTFNTTPSTTTTRKNPFSSSKSTSGSGFKDDVISSSSSSLGNKSLSRNFGSKIGGGGGGDSSSLTRSLSLGSGNVLSKRNEDSSSPTSSLSRSQTHTQLPGGINFTKSRRLSGLFQGIDLSEPPKVEPKQSLNTSFSSDGSPILSELRNRNGSNSSMIASSEYTSSLSPEIRRKSFVRSFATLSPTLKFQEDQEIEFNKSKRHSRSISEKGTSQSIQNRELPSSILHLKNNDKFSPKGSEFFEISSPGLSTPERSRRVTFTTMETSSGDLIHKIEPPYISPISSLKPLSPLRRTKNLPSSSSQSNKGLEEGSALASSSSNSEEDEMIEKGRDEDEDEEKLDDGAEEDEAISELSSLESETETFQKEGGMKLRNQEISKKLDILEIENRLKLGLMKDGRTRHPSASRSNDVRKRSKSLNHSMIDLSQGGKEEIGIRSGKIDNFVGKSSLTTDVDDQGGEKGFVRGRRMTVGHNDSDRVKISFEEVEKFRREFGIRSNSGIKTPVQQILSEEELVDSKLDTHMPPGLPFDSTPYEDLDACFCTTVTPNCSAHGTFSPSKPRTRKRSSSLLSQQLMVKNDSEEDEKKAGPSILETRRESSRQLESEIEEERKQLDALNLGKNVNQFDHEIEMAQAQAPSLPCQALQHEELCVKDGNDIGIPPGLPFTPTSQSPSKPTPARRSSLSSSFLPGLGDENEGLSRLELKRLQEQKGGVASPQMNSPTPGLGLSGVPSKAVFSPNMELSSEPKEIQKAFLDPQGLKEGFDLKIPTPRNPNPTSFSQPRSDTKSVDEDHSSHFSNPNWPKPSLPSTSSPKISHRTSPSEELRRSGFRRERTPSDATDSSFSSGYNSQSYDYGMSSPQSSAGVPSPENRRKSFADVWNSPRLVMLAQKSQTSTQTQQDPKSPLEDPKLEPEMKVQTSSSSGEKTLETSIPSSPSPSPSKPLSTLVFPVAPKASRCSFISNRLSLENPTDSNSSDNDSSLDSRMEAFEVKKKALEFIIEVIGEEKWSNTKKVLIEKERNELDDRTLLEYAAKEFNLVDHGNSNQSSKDTNSKFNLEDEILQLLAEEGYEKRWNAFVKLCAILGVDRKDLMEAKKRAGPIQKLNVK